MANYRNYKSLKMNKDEIFSDIINFISRGESFSIKKLSQGKNVVFQVSILGNRYTVFATKETFYLREGLNNIWRVFYIPPWIGLHGRTTVIYNGTEFSFNESVFKKNLNEKLFKSVFNFANDINNGRRKN